MLVQVRVRVRVRVRVLVRVLSGAGAVGPGLGNTTKKIAKNKWRREKKMCLKEYQNNAHLNAGKWRVASPSRSHSLHRLWDVGWVRAKAQHHKKVTQNNIHTA